MITKSLLAKSVHISQALIKSLLLIGNQILTLRIMNTILCYLLPAVHVLVVTSTLIEYYQHVLSTYQLSPLYNFLEEFLLTLLNLMQTTLTLYFLLQSNTHYPLLFPPYYHLFLFTTL